MSNIYQSLENGWHADIINSKLMDIGEKCLFFRLDRFVHQPSFKRYDLDWNNLHVTNADSGQYMASDIIPPNASSQL